MKPEPSDRETKSPVPPTISLDTIKMSEIVVDTRETTPLWSVPPCESKTLHNGDYSLVGFEDLIAVERKSIPDLINSVGEGRERFIRQVRRCSQVEGCVLIEGSIRAVLGHVPRGQMNGRRALATLMSWSQAYSIPVFFADGLVEAQGVALSWMKFARRKICEGSKFRHAQPICSCGGGTTISHGGRCKWKV